MKTTITVFVCGTYRDLSEERGVTLDALTQLRLPYASMEVFGARPERPIETCLDEVRNSDVLIVLVGNRYGSLVPGRQISYSEAEYEEAFRLGKRCFVYFREGDVDSGEDSDRTTLLLEWKAKLSKRHTPHYFTNVKALAVTITADLGWELRTANFPTTLKSVRHDSEIVGPKVRTSVRFGDERRQLLYTVATDNKSSIVVSGSYWGKIDLGKTVIKSQGQNIFLLKFNEFGQHIWSRSYGDSKEHVATDVKVGPAGNIYLSASFYGTIDFGGGPKASVGRYSLALAKFTESGEHIWSAAFGEGDYTVSECMALDSKERIVIGGRFTGNVDFGTGSLAAESAQTDIFVASFSGDGRCNWARRFGGPFEQQTRAVAVNRRGQIAVTGIFKGAINFDRESLLEAKPTDYRGFLTLLDEDGQTIWCKRFGEPFVESGYVLAFDEKGEDLLVTGSIRRSPSETLCLLARYDGEGVLRWSKVFGPNLSISSVSISEAGQILLAGSFQKSVELGSETLESAGGYDLFAAILDADGNVQWSKGFGDERQQFLIKGLFLANRSIVLAGSFHGSVDFGDGKMIADGYDGISEGDEDAFIAIFDQIQK